jgi:hypothetical protein
LKPYFPEALCPRSLVPPKPCAPEALFCSDFCLRPMIPRPRKSDRVRRLWRNCSGTMRQALDRSVPTRLTSTSPDAEKIRGATGIGKPRRRGALTNSVFQCPATAVSIFRNAIFDCILTACAACGRPSYAVFGPSWANRRTKARTKRIAASEWANLPACGPI